MSTSPSRQAFSAVCGPSGAGKSSLSRPWCPRSVGPGGPHTGLTMDGDLPVHVLTASPGPHPTHAHHLHRSVRHPARFADTEAARARGGRPTFNGRAGRCPTERAWAPRNLHGWRELGPSSCDGRRYAAATLEVRWQDRSIADWLGLPIADTAPLLADDPELGPLLQTMVRLGLGHLTLGQSSTTLSGGEAQQVRIASVLHAARRRPALLRWTSPTEACRQIRPA